MLVRLLYLAHNKKKVCFWLAWPQNTIENFIFSLSCGSIFFVLLGEAGDAENHLPFRVKVSGHCDLKKGKEEERKKGEKNPPALEKKKKKVHTQGRGNYRTKPQLHDKYSQPWIPVRKMVTGVLRREEWCQERKERQTNRGAWKKCIRVRAWHSVLPLDILLL